MEKNKVLKAIISASAAALMISALPASAQSGTSAMNANGAAMNGMQQSGASGAAGATASSAALTAADKKAVMDMGMANMAEVETGKMAVAKSQSADVKAFAQQMIDDHGKALTEVQALATAKGVTLPTELDAKHKAMAAKLDKLSGEKFDKEYMKNAGVADHKTVHAMLMKDEKAAKDADVKALAAKMAPTVEQHLKSAQMITTNKQK
jgi:putative membrane protein